MIDLDELERMKASAHRWQYTEKLLESADELIAMARRYKTMRRLVWETDPNCHWLFHVAGFQQVKEVFCEGDIDAVVDAMQEQKR